ncbi:MAG: hypothetical protein PVG06_18405, partial [Desulfobacterales bacterium]
SSKKRKSQIYNQIQLCEWGIASGQFEERIRICLIWMYTQINGFWSINMRILKMVIYLDIKAEHSFQG